jgi:GT2 family glycosyltransferase/tetratricopeptide (TPR) repeat protein/MoaA/NifB/PqqE/SkfB family radical SAM enzyme
MKPFTYLVEVAGSCNLKCPSCPQGNCSRLKHQRGLMDVNLFRKIVEKISKEPVYVQTLALHNWGEALLHPQLPELINIVKNNNLCCILSSNFNYIKNLDKIIAAHPNQLRISLSGFSNDTYKRTHRKGDINSVKSNMVELRRILDHHASPTRIEVCYHKYLDNTGKELADMARFSRQLGFDFVPVWAYLMPKEKNLDYYQNNIAETDKDLINLLALKPDEIKKVRLRYPQNDCLMRSNQMAINADGSVALCCAVFDTKYNIADNFLEISHADLQKLKYLHPLCEECMRHGIYPGDDHEANAELDVIAEENVSTFINSANSNNLSGTLSTTNHNLDNNVEIMDHHQQHSKSSNVPLVTIGMPVYNGERFLRQALDSLLAQDYQNFELIISDNASSDGTAAICQEYAAKDKRISFFQNSENFGAIYNFVRVMNLASGKYLMYAGDHDLWHPTLIGKAVAVLESDPEVVLCYSRTQRIDMQGNFLFLGPSCYDTRGMTPAARYIYIINNINGGEAYYGVIRLEPFKRIKRKPIWAADLANLSAFALEGTFAHLPEVLFSCRMIRDESMEGNKRNQAHSLDPARTQEMLAMSMEEHWRINGEKCIDDVQASSLTDLEKEVLISEIKSCYTRRYGVKWPDAPGDTEVLGSAGPLDGQRPPSDESPQKTSAERRAARMDRQASKEKILGEVALRRQVEVGEWPLVSVIVPTYNRPDMLVAALQSILEQTYKNHEIIVVNDCGLDVADIVGWLNKKGNITYVRHDRNRERAAARNTGLKLARGKYIAYLDDDDLFYPGHLETLVYFLENTDYRVAYTDAHRAHQAKQRGRYVTTCRDLPYSHDFNADLLLVANQFPNLCLMHEKSCLEKTGLFDESLMTHEDWDLWIRLSLYYKFFHIKKVTCEFSWRQDGSTTSSQKAADFIRTLEIIHNKYQEHVKERPHLKAAQHQFLQRQKAALEISSPECRTSDPCSPDLLEKATAAMEREDWAAAEIHLKDLTQGYPDLLEAHLSLSDVLTLQGKHREAGEVLRAARELDPESLPLIKRLGANCRQRGDLSGAMAAFNKAWNLNPKDPEILGQLGATCIDLGLLQEAQGYLQEAAQINPRNIEAWLGLARVAQHQEDREAFDEAYRRAVALNAGHPRLKELTQGRKPGNGGAAQPEIKAVREEPAVLPVRVLSSIIIPVFNNLSLTRQCLDSLGENTEGPHEIIVVDNGSTDGTRDYLSRLEAAGWVRVVYNRTNLGFAKASNQGARAARGEYLVFLNNDTIVQPGWLEEMVACATKDEKIGAVGAKLLYPDDTIQHAGVVFSKRKLVYHIYQHYDKDHPAVNKERTFQAVTAACMLIKKNIFLALGAFDEAYLNGYEDVDLCFKLREQGYKVVYNPRAVVYHLESQTPGRHDRGLDNSQIFRERWSDKIITDIDNYHQEDNIVVEILDRQGNTDTILAHDGNDNPFWQEAVQHRKEGNLDQAEACYLRAVRFSPFDPRKIDIARELADLYKTRGKHSQIKTLYQMVPGLGNYQGLPGGPEEVRENAGAV